MVGIDNGEAGFTIVEVIVGMVLLVGVIAVAAGVMSTVSLGQKNAKASTASLLDATRAVDQMGRDLRSVISPDRAEGEVQRAMLRDAVLFGQPQPGMDLRDIASAGPNEIWFRADVTPGAAGEVPVAECVRYLSNDEGLWREVRSDWRSCPAATPADTSTLLVRRPENAPATMPRSLFSYTLWFNRDTSKSPLDPRDCAKSEGVPGPFPVGDVRNNFIGAVHVDLRSVIADAQALGETRLSDTFNLRMRTNGEYQYALGCAT